MPQQSRSSHTLLRQTVVTTALSFLGILTSFGSSLVTAYFYGASLERDAYLLALVLPTYISSVVSGIVALIFIPIFMDYHTRDPQRAWHIASSLINLTIVILLLVTVACALGSRQLVSILAPAYSTDQARLTKGLLLILLPTMVFSSLSGILSSIHYAERRFLLPALAPIATTVTTLAVNIAFHHVWGIRSLALGTLGGSLLCMLLLVRGVFGWGHYTLSLDLREDGLRRMLRVSLPLFIASLAYRFESGIERIIASHLPVGSVSFIGYASQITTVLSGLTSGGIATTIFPLISRSWAEQDITATRRYFVMGIRIILLMAVPSAIGVLVFGSTIVGLLLEHGAFHHDATLAVTQCLAWLMGHYVFSSLGNVVAKGFYVTERTTVLAICTGFMTLLYLLCAWFLSRLFSFNGLAMAVSIRDIVGLILYLVLLAPLIGSENGRELLRDALKIAASGTILLLFFLTLDHWLRSSLPRILLLLLAGAVGTPLYFFLTVYVFRIEDARRLGARLLARFSPAASGADILP